MRYILALLLGFIFFTSACSSNEGSEKQDKQSAEDVFLAEIDREFGDRREFTDAQLLKTAKATCDAIDEGYSIQEIFLSYESFAENKNEIKVMAEAGSEGIAAFCPEHVDMLMKAANSQ
jgi:hypothetical protein